VDIEVINGGLKEIFQENGWLVMNAYPLEKP
jgi:hypothetical protein